MLDRSLVYKNHRIEWNEKYLSYLVYYGNTFQTRYDYVFDSIEEAMRFVDQVRKSKS